MPSCGNLACQWKYAEYWSSSHAKLHNHSMVKAVPVLLSTGVAFGADYTSSLSFRTIPQVTTPPYAHFHSQRPPISFTFCFLTHARNTQES